MVGINWSCEAYVNTSIIYQQFIAMNNIKSTQFHENT